VLDGQRESGQNSYIYNNNNILMTTEGSGGTGRKAQYIKDLRSITTI
jgi:hypothetical protein